VEGKAEKSLNDKDKAEAKVTKALKDKEEVEHIVETPCNNPKVIQGGPRSIDGGIGHYRGIGSKY
jgi:hypothetical protein